MTATIHRLSAGDGYTYLTRQVAAHDATTLSRADLAGYYSEKGERPGVWFGDGVDGLYDLQAGETVTEEQMRALFGEGRQPNSDAYSVVLREEHPKWGDQRIANSLYVGRPFTEYKDGPLNKAVAVAFAEWNVAQGHDHRAPIDPSVREEIRTRVANDLFHEQYHRAPLDDQELTGFVARAGRKERQSVSGFDVTFSPVKSVSTLWAVADQETAEQIRQAHEAAVTNALEWMEDQSVYTRTGAQGVQQRDTRGMVAARFTHRDTRAGDPDLHTHVAIANRVQDAKTGAWLTLDGRMLFKTTVGASERYNSALEAELNQRLGLQFAERSEVVRGRKQVVREVQGVPEELDQTWSSRTQQIDVRAAELAQEFTEKHHRVPSPSEMIRLRQQANLDTREAKHEPRSEAEQRAAWREQAAEVLGGEQGIDAMLSQVRAQARTNTRSLSRVEQRQMARDAVQHVQHGRAEFNDTHIRAEVERRVRAANVAPMQQEALVAEVLGHVWSDKNCIRVEPKEKVREPAVLRRADGASVYEVAHTRRFTTRTQLAQETYIVDQAGLRDAHRLGLDQVAAAEQRSAANGRTLNAGQAALVRDLGTSGARVQLALAPAGSGKTTAMAVLADAWQADGGTVIGLAPSAVAADELGSSMGVQSDTLAQLTVRLEKNAALPAWATAITPKTLVVIDEAGMASTSDLHTTIQFVTSRGGSVRLIGDDQQLAAVASGGVLRDVQAAAGAASLSELVRFRDPAEAAATLGLRSGQTEALGFYADHQRIHVAATGAVRDQVFAAWLADREAGLDTTMLAYSNEDVTALNERARAARLDQLDPAQVGASVRLASGLEASAGDVIVTRHNDRRLRSTGTDFVKNGDRWTIRNVAEDGSLEVQHQRSLAHVRLPADYAAQHVDLAYATTIHQAQGSTVDTAHVLLSGSETRQLLYVAMSRGRQASHAYLDAGIDGDEHNIVRPEYVAPLSPVEALEEIVRRDEAKHSATTQRRIAGDPATILGKMAPRFEDAPGALATSLLPAARVEQITREANQIVADFWIETHHGDESGVPVLSNDPSWPTLLGTLALADLADGDCLPAFREAVTSRELNDAQYLGALLDWRMNRANHTRSGGDGAPLPWQRPVPPALAAHPEYGSYLNSLAATITDAAGQIRDRYRTMAADDLPEWAVMLDGDRELVAELAVWRAAQNISDDESLPAGPRVPNLKLRDHQQALERRVAAAEHVARKPDPRWNAVLEAHELQHVTSDPYWPLVARRLTLAARTGADVTAMLTEAVEDPRPVPADHAAAAIWFRLAAQVQPLITDAEKQAPQWDATLREVLAPDAYRRLADTPQWGDVVAGVERAAKRHHTTGGEVVRRTFTLIDPAAIGTENGVTYGQLPATVLAQLADLSRPVVATEAPQDEPNVADPADLETRPTPAEAADAAELRTTPTLVATQASPMPMEEPPVADELPPDPMDLDQVPVELEPTPPTSVQRIVELNQAAARFYRGHYAPDSAPARYIADRMGSDLRDMDGLVIGYAPAERAGLSWWMQQTQHATPTELVDAGLAKYGRDGKLTDTFRDRVMFGLHDVDGQLVGFQGRANPTDTDAPKYLNTPDTAAFTKGAVLFGLAENAAALDNGAVIARAEGPLDALAITLAGEGHAVGVAPLGTALTDAQADLIATRSSSPAVLEATDTDPAGMAAAQKDYWKLTSRGLTPSRLVLLDTRDLERAVKDPAEALATDPDALRLALSVPELSPSLASALISQRIADDRDHLDMQSVPAIVSAARDTARIITALPPTQWEEHIEVAAAQLPTPDAASLMATETLRASTPATAEYVYRDQDQAQAAQRVAEQGGPEATAVLDSLMDRLTRGRATREAERATSFAATADSEGFARRVDRLTERLTRDQDEQRPATGPRHDPQTPQQDTQQPRL